MNREIRIFEDPLALHAAAAGMLARAAGEAIRARGEFNLVLSGGSTPKELYRLLAEQYGRRIAWERVSFFWGDERSVPPDHRDSNFRLARETLLDPLSIAETQITRIPGEMDPGLAANTYEDLLRAHFFVAGRKGDAADFPVFDVVLLGIGADGHTASLFPGTQALTESERWAVANYVPHLDTWRVTLTFPVINHAHQVIFLVSGAGKKDALKEVLQGEYNPGKYPAQAIQPLAGDLHWLLDTAAAGQLEEEAR